MDSSLISLVCYGNGYLAGKRWTAEPFGFSTKHGDYFFVRPREDAPDEEVATSPEGWFAFLEAAGAQGLRIAYAPDEKDRNRVWMMNGVVKAIEVLYPGQESEFWISYLAFPPDPNPLPPLPQFPRLQIGPAVRDPSLFMSWLRDAVTWPIQFAPAAMQRASAVHARQGLPSSQQKSWNYMHRLEERGPTDLHPLADLAALTADLHRALTDIRDFAIRTDAGFVDNFTGALDVLDARKPPTWSDLAPDGTLPPEAKRLLSACGEAWVFGGMMSWNDNPHSLPADPQERIAVEAEYDRVTAALYMAISRAMTDAANASCKTMPGASAAGQVR
jgi:hypothetical protein